MKLTHHSKQIESLKLQNRLLWTFVYFCILGGLLYITQDRVVSPCSDSGCHVVVKTVYATDDASELEQIVAYITKKFAPEGKHVVVQAINCFYSESGLRNNAIGVNKNGSNDVGVAQINSIHGMSTEDRMDYKKNIDKAYKIYKSRGNWSAWYGKGCV
jgi:hypothetical protein